MPPESYKIGNPPEHTLVYEVYQDQYNEIFFSPSTTIISIDQNQKVGDHIFIQLVNEDNTPTEFRMARKIQRISPTIIIGSKTLKYVSITIA